MLLPSKVLYRSGVALLFLFKTHVVCSTTNIPLYLCEVLPDSRESNQSVEVSADEDVDALQQQQQQSSNQRQQQRTVIGMYASQCWKMKSEVYGDGLCMLFPTEPETICWEWSPTVFEGNDNGNRNATTAVRDQIDFGRDTGTKKTTV